MTGDHVQTTRTRTWAIAVAGVVLGWVVFAHLPDQDSQGTTQPERPEGVVSNATPRFDAGGSRRTENRTGLTLSPLSAQFEGHVALGAPRSWPVRRWTDDYVDPIETRLGDPDPEIRIDAIHEAYGLAPEAAIPLLQKVLISEKDGVVAEEASAVLSDIGGEESVRVVTTALGDGDVERRLEAVEAMGRVGQPTVHLLGQVLLGDPDPELRLRAVELLSDIATPAALSLLRSASGDGETAVSLAAGVSACRQVSGCRRRGV